jgi:hypothetical protein
MTVSFNNPVVSLPRRKSSWAPSDAVRDMIKKFTCLPYYSHITPVMTA